MTRATLTEHYGMPAGEARTLREQLEEGIEIAADSAVLTYQDRKRERRLFRLFPTRASAERHAEGLLRERRVRSNSLAIRTVEEALA